MLWKSRPRQPRRNVQRHQFGVLPTEREYKELDEMLDSRPLQELERFWPEVRDLERHEDTLFNNRFQSLLVSTSFLIGAFFAASGKRLFIARVLLCIAALVFTLQMKAVMVRSARAIEWYLAALVRMDKRLYPEPLQPYRFRRKQAKRLDENNRPIGGRTVLSRMAVLFPNGIIVLWLSLLLWAVSNVQSTAVYRLLAERHALKAGFIVKTRSEPRVPQSGIKQPGR